MRAQPAEDVHLTLDLQVQSIAEEEISKAVTEFGAKWGGVLVVDVAAGDVLAWAQFLFQSQFYNQYRPSGYRNRLAQDAGNWSPRSPFLIASALQEGVVTRDTTFNCENGLWKSRYITIRDDSRPKQNIQSVAKILANSSNIGCGKIGLELGAVKYQRYLSRLGFSERTSVQLAESRGILRPAREWSEADLISSSFGQSLSVTVLQMAQAYLTLANEGVYKPLRIVLTDDVGGGDQRIFQNTTREVLSMMREVVDEGTGKGAAIPGVSVAGKTGTAQKAFRGKYGGKRTASFVGLVPAEKPQYLVVIFIDEPSKVKYGGVIAAPVFKSVTSRVMAYHGSLPDPGALTPAQIKAQEKAEARARARAVRRGSKEKTVLGEYRSELATKKTALPVRDSGTVPDVVGQSVRRAVEMFARQGLSLSSWAMVQECGRQTPNRACVGREGFGPHVMRSLAFRAGIMGMYPLSLLESRVAAQGMELCIDSRKATPGCVFVALPGSSADGSQFIADAVARGAGYVVCRPESAGNCGEAEVVDCADPRRALLLLARARYGTASLPFPVVGVTGTNGKTTTTYLLDHLFASAGKKTGVLGTVSYRWPGHHEDAPMTTPDCLDVHTMLADMRAAGVDMVSDFFARAGSEPRRGRRLQRGRVLEPDAGSP